MSSTSNLPELPGSYEKIASNTTMTLNGNNEYLDGFSDSVTSAILVNTEVDSYDDPTKPAIGWDADNTWVLMWYYDSIPQVKDELRDPSDGVIYHITRQAAEFNIRYGQNIFDRDLNTSGHFPQSNEDDSGLSFSIGVGIGPISAGIGRVIPGTSRVGLDHSPYQYTEWDYPVPYFPQGQDDAVGVVFDVEANSRETTAQFQARWSRGFEIRRTDARGRVDIVYTRDEGDFYIFDVDIVATR